jgi:hypothetical protein
MFNIIQRNPFAIILVCALLLLILWIPAFLFPGTPCTPDLTFMMPLQQWTVETIQLQGNTGLYVSFITVSLTTCMLFTVNRKHLFVAEQEQLMLMLFVLIASAMPCSQQFSGSQVAALLALLSINYLFNAIQAIRAVSSLFLSSFCATLAALFYFPAAIMLFTVFFGILFSKPFAWRDWIAYFSGMASPYFYFFLYHYLRYGSSDFFQIITGNIPSPEMPAFTFSIPEILLFACLTIIALCAFFPLRSSGSLTKIKHTRMRQILKCLLLCLLVPILLFSPQPGIMSLVALPLSILAADYYDHIRRKKMFNLLLFLLCIAVLGIRILHAE